MVEEEKKKTHTILIIDDQPLLRTLLNTRLEKDGFLVYEAFDAFSGLDAIRNVSPDLVICDLGMPKMSGYDLMKQIQADPDLTFPPFIILTANYDSLTRIKGMELGALEVFAKPIPIEKLMETIRKTLSTK